MIVRQSIARNLTASDFERIYFYCPRIRYFGRLSFSDLEAQVLPIIWSRKPSPGPFLCNLSEAELVGDSFNGLALPPRLIIGPCIRTIRLNVLRDPFSWANVTALLKKTAPLHLSNFTLIGSIRALSWPEAESLELLSTLRGVRTLSINCRFLTSHAICLISAFPALEDLRISVTEKEMKDRTLSMTGNSFPAATRLAISSNTINACHLMLEKIQSKTFRSLTVTRTTYDPWNIRKLFIALYVCNLASRLEILEVRNCPWIGSSPVNSLSEESFKIDARTFECLDSFEHLRELLIQPSSVDLADDDLFKLAKSLPHLRSLVFYEFYDLDNVPKCTFTGIQHLIQFCPKLAKLTLCIDPREIPIFAAQLNGEDPCGLHLTDLDLGISPITNACNVATYLIVLLPALTDFSTAYSDGSPCAEEGANDSYCKIWLEVEELLDPIVAGKARVGSI